MQNIIVRRKVIVQQTTLMQCIIETYRRNRKTLCRALDRKDQKLQHLLINTLHIPHLAVIRPAPFKKHGSPVNARKDFS